MPLWSSVGGGVQASSAVLESTMLTVMSRGGLAGAACGENRAALYSESCCTKRCTEAMQKKVRVRLTQTLVREVMHSHR